MLATSPEGAQPSHTLSGLPWISAIDMPGLLAMVEAVYQLPMVSVSDALFELGEIDAAAAKAHADRASNNDDPAGHDIPAAPGGSGWSEGTLDHARARAVRTAEVDADVFEIDPQSLVKLPWAAAVRLGALPLGMADGRLYVASPNPLSPDLTAQLSVVAECPVSLVWASTEAVARRLASPTHSMSAEALDLPRPPGRLPERVAADDVDLAVLLSSAQNEVQAHGSFVPDYVVDERSSVVQLVKRIVLDAYAQKASDIHIETNPDGLSSRVRLRKDGDLEDYLRLPPALRAALVSRIKVMSRLDISERRRPQDGKINFAEFSGIKLELRVAVLPTHDGLEDVVLRLLATSSPMPLSQLGFCARDEAIIERLALRPYGLLLACGPTGSGKTTTLHSLLAEINTPSRKIWTAEDPIEITQPGLRQLQVNPKIGLTFASAMRAFLRADPDVIMIGEVRDEETARIAIEASLTGHLVFSTLHTNNAAESVVRLLDLGMDPMNFGDSLIGIVAQRLVRALCTQCKQPLALSLQQVEQLAADYVEGTALTIDEARSRLLLAGGWDAPDKAHIFQPQGCPICNAKGYKGRIGIYEVLQNGAELKLRIQSRAATSLIFAQGIETGMRSLKQDALEKVCAGLIDLKQAMTVYA